jgi:hypothetical protein
MERSTIYHERGLANVLRAYGDRGGADNAVDPANCGDTVEPGRRNSSESGIKSVHLEADELNGSKLHSAKGVPENFRSTAINGSGGIESGGNGIGTEGGVASGGTRRV